MRIVSESGKSPEDACFIVSHPINSALYFSNSFHRTKRYRHVDHEYGIDRHADCIGVYTLSYAYLRRYFVSPNTAHNSEQDDFWTCCLPNLQEKGARKRSDAKQLQNANGVSLRLKKRGQLLRLSCINQRSWFSELQAILEPYNLTTLPPNSRR